MKRNISALLVVTVLLAGCAGRTAQPVQTHRVGDSGRRTEAIETEMSEIDAEIMTKESKRREVLITNVVLGVTGFFVIVPLFFMNFKDAEGTEIEALRQRKAWLISIMETRGQLQVQPTIIEP